MGRNDNDKRGGGWWCARCEGEGESGGGCGTGETNKSISHVMYLKPKQYTNSGNGGPVF